jgi:hypothetical protein
MTSVFQRVLAVICLACLANVTRAEERASPIRDGAGLFRADAVARAEQQIDEIRRTYGRNVFVETVKSASPQKWHWKWFLGTREVNRLLQEQAEKRADAAGADGIYVVICNDPRAVHVVVRPADDPAFTPHDAETLRRTVARLPRGGSPNEALLAVVRQVQTILQAHATRGQTTSVVSEFVLAGVLAGGLGIWLVLWLIRYKMRSRRPEDPVEETAEEQVRRRPALLGAMFGFPAGHWIYDKLYPSPTQAAALPVREPPVEAEGNGTEKTDADGPPAEERVEDAPIPS